MSQIPTKPGTSKARRWLGCLVVVFLVLLCPCGSFLYFGKQQWEFRRAGEPFRALGAEVRAYGDGMHGGGGGRVVTRRMEGANRDLSEALLLHGESSVEARAARLGVEIQRTGEAPNAINIDRATFEQPKQYAVGIDYVIVNGQVVIEKGSHNGARAGRRLRGRGLSEAK